MQNQSKGNTTIVIVVIIVLIILAFFVFKNKDTEMYNAENEDTTSQQETSGTSGNTQTGNPSTNGSASANTDFSGVDSNINSLDQDSADVDGSISDYSNPQ